MLRQEFYNNTGKRIWFEDRSSDHKVKYVECEEGQHYSRREYAPQEGKAREITIVIGEEEWIYKKIHTTSASHMRLLPIPVPGFSWIIRLQINADGSMRMIPKGEVFPLPASVPDAEGFPKVPVEKRPLTIDQKIAIPMGTAIKK